MADKPGHWTYRWYEILTGPDTGKYVARSGGHGGQITLVSPKKGWSDMVDKDPSFSDIMSKELGGEEEFGQFMSEWGSSYKKTPGKKPGV